MVTSDTIPVLKNCFRVLLTLVEIQNLFKFIGKSFGIIRIFPDCFKDGLDH